MKDFVERISSSPLEILDCPLGTAVLQPELLAINIS
jgi:hypothetical protein